ncbi:MAG: hypothetical protein QXD03_01815 [Candidatus Anstonellales archaeon]
MDAAIILETTSPSKKENILNIIENVNSENGNKIVFKARLQTAEEKNQNGRYYRRDICEQIVNLLKPKAKSRSLLQEVDHPLVILPGSVSDSSDLAAKKRAITIEIKNSGSLIRDISMEKNDVVAIIETLTGFRGPDLYKLIVNDRVNIGFSLRMFGRLVMDNSNGYMLVQPPLKPVTYDVVTNPSHQSASILEFLPEDASNLIDLSQQDIIITESTSIVGSMKIKASKEVLEYVREMIDYSYKKNKFIRFKI